jgi:hypothetical protein
VIQIGGSGCASQEIRSDDDTEPSMLAPVSKLRPTKLRPYRCGSSRNVYAKPN